MLLEFVCTYISPLALAEKKWIPQSYCIDMTNGNAGFQTNGNAEFQTNGNAEFKPDDNAEFQTNSITVAQSNRNDAT